MFELAKIAIFCFFKLKKYEIWLIWDVYVKYLPKIEILDICRNLAKIDFLTDYLYFVHFRHLHIEDRLLPKDIVVSSKKFCQIDSVNAQLWFLFCPTGGLSCAPNFSENVMAYNWKQHFCTDTKAFSWNFEEDKFAHEDTIEVVDNTIDFNEEKQYWHLGNSVITSSRCWKM